MSERQLVTPLIVDGTKAVTLHRLPFGDHELPESWLQELLFKYPTLVPVEDIEPVFSGLIPLAREVPTEAGPLDLLFVNRDGLLTLVETKLWRNPGARREVVAQIIDYAKEMSTWSYDELVDAVRNGDAASIDPDPIVASVQKHDEEFDEKRFIDRLKSNLRRGRFLLLIVGDGIQEGVERMAAFLQQTPQLGFTLGLVEIGLYRENVKKGPLFVQPRVLARTVEIARAVVEIRVPMNPADIVVTLPLAETKEGEKRVKKISEDVFFERLSKSVNSNVVAFVKWTLGEVPRHGLHVVYRGAGPALRYKHPNTSQLFSFGYFHHEGTCGFGWIDGQCEEAGIPEQIGTDYLNEVAALIPGVQVLKDGKWMFKGTGDDPQISLLMEKKEPWLAAVDRAVARINKELDEK